MFKKTILAAWATLTLTTGASAFVLTDFQTDFGTLMNSVARDVAPTLRLGALSGDLQGDASIEHFDLTIFALGFNMSDGLGKVLDPNISPSPWNFVVPMSSFVPSGFTAFEKLMLYPSVKFAFGMAVANGWDATLSGNFLPSQAGGLAAPFLSGKAAPELGYANLGLQVRKTLLVDTANGPALSLGTSYHYSSFHLKTIVDDYIPAVSLGSSQTQTTTGSIALDTGSQVFTVDLHVSKHLAFFTPYAKFSGAYQLSSVTGDADLVADVLDTSGPPSHTYQPVKAHSEVKLSDFTFLTTTGFDLNLLLFHYNLNVVADVGRAFLRFHNLSLDGIEANAFSINTGFHFAF